MPVYEYECPACDHVTEAIRRMADADTPQACEKCGSAKTGRKHSVFSAQGGGQQAPAAPGACAMPGMGGGCCGGMCHGRG